MSINYVVDYVFGYCLDEDSVRQIEFEYSTSFEDLVESNENFKIPEGCILVSFNDGYCSAEKRYAVGVSAEYIDRFLREALDAKLIKQNINNEHFCSIAPDPTPLISWSRKFGLKLTTETPVLVTGVNAY